MDWNSVLISETFKSICLDAVSDEVPSICAQAALIPWHVEEHTKVSPRSVVVNEPSAVFAVPSRKIYKEVVLAFVLLRMAVHTADAVRFIVMLGISVCKNSATKRVCIKIKIDFLSFSNCVVQAGECVEHALTGELNIADRLA